jgi:rhodanese-related sulfurtransferase
MTISQIVLYAIIGLLLLLYGKRFIQRVRMKEYSASEVAQKLNDGSVLLLDVRTHEERNHSAIIGSLHIPLGEIVNKLKTLENHRQKEIICYCHSGSRSMAAVSLLQKNGFNAANMKGGIIEWKFLNLKS